MDTSAFAPAYVARIPKEDNDHLSAVLIQRDLGHLAVRIFFHRAPMANLAVTFYFRSADGSRGDHIGTEVKTDDAGLARSLLLVPAGNYICSVEYQSDALVSTVADPNVPFILVLPIGRPYVDLGADPEFQL